MRHRGLTSAQLAPTKNHNERTKVTSAKITLNNKSITTTTTFV